METDIDTGSGNKKRLITMFILNTIFFLLELVVGLMTNSTALVADGFSMLSDVVSLMVAFISEVMAAKEWSRSTFGYARAEVLGALINAVFQMALCFSIAVESIQRFIKPEKIEDPTLILYVGIAGLLINIVGLVVFFPRSKKERGKEKHEEKEKQCKKTGKSATQLNMNGVFLHVLADAMGSIMVITSALVILLVDWEYKWYVDPTLSMLLVIFILISAWPLLRESSMVMLQTIPKHIKLDKLKENLIQEVKGVVDIHELHVWQLTGTNIVASAKICCTSMEDYPHIAEKVKEFFHKEGIHSITIQPEFNEFEKPTALDCISSPNNSCIAHCDLKEDMEKRQAEDKECYQNDALDLDEIKIDK